MAGVAGTAARFRLPALAGTTTSATARIKTTAKVTRYLVRIVRLSLFFPSGLL